METLKINADGNEVVENQYRIQTEGHYSEDEFEEISDLEDERNNLISEDIFKNQQNEKDEASKPERIAQSKSRKTSLFTQRSSAMSALSINFEFRPKKSGSSSSLFNKKRKGSHSQMCVKKGSVIQQRLNSAKEIQIKDLTSKIRLLESTIADLNSENRSLKTIFLRQDVALKKYEGTESDFPKVLTYHQNEVKYLQQTIRKMQGIARKNEASARALNIKIISLEDENAQLQKLVRDNELLERKKLQEQVKEILTKHEMLRERLSENSHRYSLLVKNHGHELSAMKNKLKEAHRKVYSAEQELCRLSEVIRQKDRVISYLRMRSRTPRLEPPFLKQAVEEDKSEYNYVYSMENSDPVQLLNYYHEPGKVENNYFVPNSAHEQEIESVNSQNPSSMSISSKKSLIDEDEFDTRSEISSTHTTEDFIEENQEKIDKFENYEKERVENIEEENEDELLAELQVLRAKSTEIQNNFTEDLPDAEQNLSDEEKIEIENKDEFLKDDEDVVSDGENLKQFDEFDEQNFKQIEQNDETSFKGIEDYAHNNGLKVAEVGLHEFNEEESQETDFIKSSIEKERVEPFKKIDEKFKHERKFEKIVENGSGDGANIGKKLDDFAVDYPEEFSELNNNSDDMSKAILDILNSQNHFPLYPLASSFDKIPNIEKLPLVQNKNEEIPLIENKNQTIPFNQDEKVDFSEQEDKNSTLPFSICKNLPFSEIGTKDKNDCFSLAETHNEELPLVEIKNSDEIRPKTVSLSKSFESRIASSANYEEYSKIFENPPKNLKSENLENNFRKEPSKVQITIETKVKKPRKVEVDNKFFQFQSKPTLFEKSEMKNNLGDEVVSKYDNLLLANEPFKILAEEEVQLKKANKKSSIEKLPRICSKEELFTKIDLQTSLGKLVSSKKSTISKLPVLKEKSSKSKSCSTGIAAYKLKKSGGGANVHGKSPPVKKKEKFTSAQKVMSKILEA